MPENRIIYNGIYLPSNWPPVVDNFSISYTIPTPYYILNPPKIIDIDVGRQLFVDNFLIDKTTCKKSFYKPEAFEGNPIIFADKIWEKSKRGNIAMPYSDGIWHDPIDDCFKMFYVGGDFDNTCLVISTDGINWEKPVLKNKTNIVIFHSTKRDSASIIFDLEEENKKRIIKMVCWSRLYRKKNRKKNTIVYIFCSSNGIDWNLEKEYENTLDDRSTVFYNPFRKVWSLSARRPIYFSKENGDLDAYRARFYGEDENIIDGYLNCVNNLHEWVYSDPLDENIYNYCKERKGPVQLYNLDVFAYESLLVGQFNLLSADANETGRPKINQIFLGFSRDGFSWDRTNRNVFIPVSEKEKDWNWGNVQSIGGFLVVKDKLYFYCSGRNTNRGSTGLYFLRRDGFASMDSSEKTGYVVTRLLKFSTGKYLFVNAEIKNGFLLTQITDDKDNIILSFEDCISITIDNTLINVSWKSGNDLSFLKNKEIKIHFKLLSAKIYSFWISESLSGISNGYIGANKVL